MAELIDETSSIESTTVGVYRTSSTVAGGRRFSFSAMVVVGDRRGRAGIGYAKSNQVPQSIEKAQKEGRRKMSQFQLQGKTIPHMVVGRFGATTVKLIPAAPGTGVIAGAAVRAVLEMIGVQDCLTQGPVLLEPVRALHPIEHVVAVRLGADRVGGHRSEGELVADEVRGQEMGAGLRAHPR